MKKIALVAILAFLTGCQSQDVEKAAPTKFPQYDPKDPTPWCLAASDVLANPWLDDYRKEVLLETMRNRGCMR